MLLSPNISLVNLPSYGLAKAAPIAIIVSVITYNYYDCVCYYYCDCYYCIVGVFVLLLLLSVLLLLLVIVVCKFAIFPNISLVDLPGYGHAKAAPIVIIVISIIVITIVYSRGNPPN